MGGGGSIIGVSMKHGNVRHPPTETFELSQQGGYGGDPSFLPLYEILNIAR